MQVATEKLVALLLGMWRFRWLALGVAWACALLGWIYVWLMPDVYQVKTRIYVDSETVLKPLLSGLAVGTDVQSDLSTMSALLLSRPNLEKVARETGLIERAETERQRENMITNLGVQIYLSKGRDGTYTIGYRDVDKDMAFRLVTAMLRGFVDNTQGLKKEDSTGAQTFLTQQLEQYEVRLREAEEALADFKRKNLGLMPGQSGDYYTRMQLLQTTIEGLRTRYRQLSERRGELERQIEGEDPTFGSVQASADAGPNDGTIAGLEAKIAELKLQYTERHPDIVSMRATIDQLREDNRRKREAGVFGPNRGGQRLDINPVYQSMRIALSQTDAELAEVRGQLGEQEGQMGVLRSRMNVAPEVEAQLARLNRDYEVNRAQYTALLQRLESARISESAESTNQKLNFRIVDPPEMPKRPVEPNRFILTMLVTVLACGLGAAIAFALNLFRPVFSNRRAVQQALSIPVLGSISIGAKQSTAAGFRSEHAIWFVVLAAFLAMFFANAAYWFLSR